MAGLGLHRLTRRAVGAALVCGPYAIITFATVHDDPVLAYWTAVVTVCLIEVTVYNEWRGGDPLLRENRRPNT